MIAFYRRGDANVVCRVNGSQIVTLTSRMPSATTIKGCSDSQRTLSEDGESTGRALPWGRHAGRYGPFLRPNKEVRRDPTRDVVSPDQSGSFGSIVT